jgi:hypothetical protein
MKICRFIETDGSIRALFESDSSSFTRKNNLLKDNE